MAFASVLDGDCSAFYRLAYTGLSFAGDAAMQPRGSVLRGSSLDDDAAAVANRAGALFCAFAVSPSRFAIVTPSGRRIELDRCDLASYLAVTR